MRKKKALIIFAGANGAGKTTAAEYLLPRKKIKEFINADEIARGLSPFNPAGQKVAAGRLVLDRIRSLMSKGDGFAFESTLSGRSQIAWLKEARRKGYEICLYYIHTQDVRINLGRIAGRVKQGGHHVSAVDVRRRYKRSLKNLFSVYESLCDTVDIYDNSAGEMVLVASKSAIDPQAYLVFDEKLWNDFIDKAEQNEN